MLCIHKKTLKKIVKKRHSFVAQVKKNQKTLLEQIKFNISIKDTTPIDSHTSHDCNNHGRYETRIVEVYDDLYLIEDDWDMAKSIVTVTSEVIIGDKIANETRYYISNLTQSAKSFSHIIRSHWKIENSLHYVKDVAFLEDFSRMRTEQIPSVASLLRSVAINILNMNEFSNITQARKLLAWGNENIFSLKCF